MLPTSELGTATASIADAVQTNIVVCRGRTGESLRAKHCRQVLAKKKKEKPADGSSLAEGFALGVYPDGSMYKGEFQGGRRHGFGVHHAGNGVTKYTGQWRGGRRDGEGLMTYDRLGQVYYAGSWSDGKKHGEGTQVWPSGSVFTGQWLHGVLHGTGKMTWRYEDHVEEWTGMWIDGQPSGEGIATSRTLGEAPLATSAAEAHLAAAAACAADPGAASLLDGGVPIATTAVAMASPAGRTNGAAGLDTDPFHEVNRGATSATAMAALREITREVTADFMPQMPSKGRLSSQCQKRALSVWPPGRLEDYNAPSQLEHSVPRVVDVVDALRRNGVSAPIAAAEAAPAATDGATRQIGSSLQPSCPSPRVGVECAAAGRLAVPGLGPDKARSRPNGDFKTNFMAIEDIELEAPPMEKSFRLDAL